MSGDSDLTKQGGEGAVFRDEVRRQRIAARMALSPRDHARKSIALLTHLDALLAKRSAGLLGIYWPIRAEVDCRPLAISLLQRGWRICLPYIAQRHQALSFREWTPESVMVNGEHDIPTVAEGPLVQPDVLLLPVNAYDGKGHRLGYGGGYYDRTLAVANPRPFAIGIGFALARVDSITPEVQDQRLDAVVTESGSEEFA